MSFLSCSKPPIPAGPLQWCSPGGKFKFSEEPVKPLIREVSHTECSGILRLRRVRFQPNPRANTSRSWRACIKHAPAQQPRPTREVLVGETTNGSAVCCSGRFGLYGPSRNWSRFEAKASNRIIAPVLCEQRDSRSYSLGRVLLWTAIRSLDQHRSRWT